jgi:hypothetical protein
MLDAITRLDGFSRRIKDLTTGVESRFHHIVKGYTYLFVAPNPSWAQNQAADKRWVIENNFPQV